MSPRHALAALALAAAVAALPAAAHAECAAPQPFIAAPVDGVVAPDPTVFIFTPRGMTLEKVRVEGRDQATLGVRQEPVGGTESWAAARVRVTAGKPGKITVVAVIGGWGDTTFEVRRDLEVLLPVVRPKDPSSAPPRPAPKATVVDYGVSSFGWTCSHERIRKLGVDVAAPAYRVELMAGDEVRRAAVFPDSSDRFYAHGDEAPRALPVVLGLGHINCLGTSFEWRGLGDANLRVTALLPDGREVASDVVRVPAP